MRAHALRGTAIMPAVLALAALALAGCAVNEARLSDGQVDASQRAECAAASSAMEPSLHGEHSEAPPPWCRDERGDVELWSSEDKDPMKVDFEGDAGREGDSEGIFRDDASGDD